MRGKNVCDTHGGLSKRPRTQEGIKCIQNAHWKRCNETKEAHAEPRRMSLIFQILEEIGWHVGLFAVGSTKTRCRKAGQKHNLNGPDQLALAIL